MKKYRVTIASTIYYQAEIEAESESQIDNDFDNGILQYVGWNEIDLESSIESIREIKQ
jgi:hypothetical protein